MKFLAAILALTFPAAACACPLGFAAYGGGCYTAQAFVQPVYQPVVYQQAFAAQHYVQPVVQSFAYSAPIVRQRAVVQKQFVQPIIRQRVVVRQKSFFGGGFSSFSSPFGFRQGFGFGSGLSIRTRGFSLGIFR